jgi:chemotaxis signal transduction protein
MGARGARAGLLALDDAAGGSTHVWVFDLGSLLGHDAAPRGDGGDVVVIRQGERALGLLVGGLHGVTRFGRAAITPTPFAGAGAGTLVREVIQADGGTTLIQVLDTEALFAMLAQAQPA